MALVLVGKWLTLNTDLVHILYSEFPFQFCIPLPCSYLEYFFVFYNDASYY